MRESCLAIVYCFSGTQSLFEVVLLYTFHTRTLIICRFQGAAAQKKFECMILPLSVFLSEFHLEKSNAKKAKAIRYTEGKTDYYLCAENYYFV